jgi:hypothetical protein
VIKRLAKSSVYGAAGKLLGVVRVGDFVRFDRGEQRTRNLSRFNVRKITCVYEEAGKYKIDLVDIKHTMQTSTIQINSIVLNERYEVAYADDKNVWRNFYRLSRENQSSKPCKEIELPTRKSSMHITSPRRTGKSFFDEAWKAYAVTQFKQEYQAAFIDKEATLTVSSKGINTMNRGNLENPINNVRYTEVNGTKITEMSDRQLIGAIYNFNNEITELQNVPVESKAINKHIKRLEKAIKRCVSELDAR